MARKSAAEKSVFATMVTLEQGVRPAPPKSLAPPAAKVWQRVVNSMPPTWFTPETHDLLESYCRHVASLAFIDKVISEIERAPEGDLMEWRRMTNARRQEDRLITILATKMRLAQQSSYDKMAVKAAKARGGSVKTTSPAEFTIPSAPKHPWS